MKLTRVRKVLHRRLAYLEAVVDRDEGKAWAREERDALETILRCQGMLDEERLSRNVEAVRERVIPAVERTAARAHRGAVLYDEVLGIVDALHRAQRVA